MGLGKTVQTIAFLAWLNHQSKGKIICDETDSNGGNSDDSDLDDEENVLSKSSPIQRPHLIVVPASVLNNWINEFKKFAPHMKGEHHFRCVFLFTQRTVSLYLYQIIQF